jgi:hypothetical protein
MPLTNGLLNWWKMNESSGTRADSVGTIPLPVKTNGAVGSASPAGTPSGLGLPVAAFDGAANDWLNGTAGAAITGPPFSITGWFKGNGVFGNLFGIVPNIGAPNVGLLINNSNVLQITSGPNNYFGTTALGSNWHHVVLTWDNNNLLAYLDGITGAPEISSTGGGQLSFFNAARTIFGSDGGGGILTGNGAAWGVYNRILTAQEIQTLFANGNALQYSVFYPFGTFITGALKTFSGNGQTLPKLPEENEPFNFDFSKYLEILAGLTISSATMTIRTPLGAQPLTVTAQPAVNGSTIQPWLSGGSPANTYLLIMDCTLNNGSVISMFDHISIPAVA